MWSLPDSEKAGSAGASERALVGAAQRGSEPAVEELFRRHWPNTHRAAFLIVHDAAAAEDIAQEAFLSAMSSLDRFDRRRPFAPWLHRIAVNRAIDWSRARAVRGEVAATGTSAEGGSEPSAAETLGEREEIAAALAELSPEHRALVVLRYLLEYTPGEIARMLDLPRGTVNSRLRRALDRLSGLLGGCIVREQKLREALLDVRVPGASGAEERSRRLVRAAYASAPPALRPRRRVRTRRALQVAIAVGLLAVAISPAGAAIGDWVGDRVDPAREPAQPALTSLPAPGNLLVDSARGPWVVGEDGGKRLLGEYRESAWSPHGLYVAVAEEHELAAVDPLGEARWALSRDGPVRMPAWSPDGERVAYLSGAEIRLVAGDGDGDRLLDRGVAPVAPAWRWGGARVLSYLTRDGRVRTLQTDTGRVVFEAPAPAGTHSLAWSANGERLLLVGSTRIEAIDGGGERAWAVEAPVGSEVGAAAISPGGDRAATILVSTSGDRSKLALLGPGGGGRVLFEGLGRFDDVTYSPDGEWLLLAWRSADEWLFLNPARPRRVVAVSDIAAQFDPGTTSPPSFPSVSGWCCPPTG